MSTSVRDGYRSGGGQPLREKVGADWGYWQQIAVAKVWEAAYLAVDINPAMASIRDENYPYLSITEYESKATLILKRLINERLDIAKSHLKVGAFELVTYYRGAEGLHSEVELAEFGKWAKLQGWELPENFPCSSLHNGCSGWGGFDPTDEQYPEELDIAMQAWRAVSNGQGGDGTPKQRLIKWLESSPYSLKTEQVKRIATICNWEKGAGRPSK